MTVKYICFQNYKAASQPLIPRMLSRSVHISRSSLRPKLCLRKGLVLDEQTEQVVSASTLCTHLLTRQALMVREFRESDRCTSYYKRSAWRSLMESATYYLNQPLLLGLPQWALFDNQRRQNFSAPMLNQDARVTWVKSVDAILTMESHENLVVRKYCSGGVKISP